MWELRALFSLWGLTLAPDALVLDSGVHLPVLYDSFVPPALGQTYVDQTFSTTIKRLSDAVNTPNHAASGNLLWIGTEYPTASPWNVNNSWLILQHQGYFGLYDGGGTYVRDLPFSVNAATEPRWSRTDPNVLFYVSGNRLMRLDVSAGASSIVRTFSEYSAIRGRGESDISRDGDHFVFAGDAPGGLANRYVFVYQISTNTKGAVLDTIGHSFNQLYLASDNSVALGWIAAGTARYSGVELFDRNMIFQRQLTRAIGHMRLTRDTNGADVLIWTNSGDPQPIPNCQNGIVKVRLSNAQQTCLLQLDWSLAVHITAGDGDGWAFVETYDPADPPASTPAWKPYTNEIIQVKLDGTEARRLLHHRSRQTANYEYQPRATVSRDGTTLVYSSTYNLEGTSGHAFGYTDAYMIAVPGSPTPQLSIADVTAHEGTGATTMVFTVRLSHITDVPVSVQYQTANGTATAGSDYTAAGPLTLTFPPLTASRTFSITLLGDHVIEPDETFHVNLSNPTNATLSDPSGLGTIINDDSTRVFVAHSGDDAGLCSNIATPCRSLAGAMTQAAENGEIIVMTSGEYETAPLVITRGVAVSASLGAVVLIRQPITLAAPGARVVLRGLTLKGAGVSTALTLTAGHTLSLEDSSIERWNVGFRIANTTGARVIVSNVVFRGNGSGINDDGGPAGNRVAVEETRFEGNLNGIDVWSGAFVVRESAFVGNSGNGVVAGPGTVQVHRSEFAFNTTGVRTRASGTARISGCRVFGNATGLWAEASSSLVTAGGNGIRGNGVNTQGVITAAPAQ